MQWSCCDQVSLFQFFRCPLQSEKGQTHHDSIKGMLRSVFFHIILTADSSYLESWSTKLNSKLWHQFVHHFRTLQSKRGMKQLKQHDFPRGGILSVRWDPEFKSCMIRYHFVSVLVDIVIAIIASTIIRTVSVVTLVIRNNCRCQKPYNYHCCGHHWY